MIQLRIDRLVGLDLRQNICNILHRSLHVQFRKAGLVGCIEDLRQGQEGIVRRNWLVLFHVETSSSKMATLNSLVEGLFVNQRASCDVDQNSSFFHSAHHTSVDHVNYLAVMCVASPDSP